MSIGKGQQHHHHHHRQPYYRTSSHLFITTTSSSNNDSNNDNNDDGKPTKRDGGNGKRGGTKKQKIQINDNDEDFDLDALTAAFDKMAKKEGFDGSTALYADDASFEEEFTYEEGKTTLGEDMDLDGDLELDLDDDDEDDHDDDDDDDFLDFGTDDDDDTDTRLTDDMDARIQAAQRDQDSGGRIAPPPKLRTITSDDMANLGFGIEKKTRSYRPRDRNFPNSDPSSQPPPSQPTCTLMNDAMVCSACGSDFQGSDDLKPGFLPKEKYDIQKNLGKLEEVIRLQEKVDQLEGEGGGEWSTEDEIEWLLKSTTTVEEGGENLSSKVDIEAMAVELGLDPRLLSTTSSTITNDELDMDTPPPKKPICKRCHTLQYSSTLPAPLRPSPTTTEPSLTQSHFRSLLLPLSSKPCVLIALVDLFDFTGSVLPELDAIAGPDNPVVVAANKADLLPSNMGQQRVENWVRRELEFLGVESLANVGGSVRLVSCKTGFGVEGMLEKARGIAGDMGCDVYVVGAANAGKSTLINYILEKGGGGGVGNKGKEKGKKKRPGNANQKKSAVTTSPLPGTTLKFIKVEFGNGGSGGRGSGKDEVSLYDTPGLLIPGTITQMLTPEELKMVVPKKPVEPVTFRVATGKCVLIGGLAKIEIIGDETKPFLLTFYVSNDIKLHPTDSARADAFRAKHSGTPMLSPPVAQPMATMDMDGALEYHEVEIAGAGWKEAGADIAIRGLGWIAVTGSGKAKVRVGVPKGVGVSVRPPLMPFDIWESAARYTGGKAVRKAGTGKFGKKRRGVGRR